MDIKLGETLMLLPFVLCDSAGRQRFERIPGTVVQVDTSEKVSSLMKWKVKSADGYFPKCPYYLLD